MLKTILFVVVAVLGAGCWHGGVASLEAVYVHAADETGPYPNNPDAEYREIFEKYPPLDSPPLSATNSPMRTRLVAHAGGGLLGFVGSNSLEALEESVRRGFTYIELDIITTSDDIIVLNHSWNTLGNRIPGAPGLKLSYEEFMALGIFQNLQPMNLPMLIDFLETHPHVTIITDTKATDYAALHEIAEHFPEYIGRFLPQVYSTADVQHVRGLGFHEVLVTVYMMPPAQRQPEVLAAGLEQEGIAGLVIPESMYGSLQELLGDLGVPLFVHTIDDVDRALELFEKGVYGVFTGGLAPGPQYPYVRNAMYEGIAHILEALDTGLPSPEGIAVYHVGAGFGVQDGSAFSIGSLGRMSAPFELYGHTYLPIRHVAEFLRVYEYRWHPEAHAISFRTPDGEWLLRNGYEARVYNDSFFVNTQTLAPIFPEASFWRVRDIAVVARGATHLGMYDAYINRIGAALGGTIFIE